MAVTWTLPKGSGIKKGKMVYRFITCFKKKSRFQTLVKD